MTKQRANLGFSNALDTFNLDEWKIENKKDSLITNDEIENLNVNQIAKQAAIVAGFKSRESKDVKPILRRRRTGRNTQFNLKAHPKTIATFCAIADQHDWGLGETLEKAVILLEREYMKK